MSARSGDDNRVVKEFGGRIEPSEHVDEHLPVAVRVGIDDTPGAGAGGLQRQLAQYVLAGLEDA